MSVVVLIIGLLVMGLGLVVLAAPALLKPMVNKFIERRWMVFVVVFRITIGVLLFVAASDTRAPAFVLLMGILFIVAGILIPILGIERIKSIANWWIERSETVMRLWAAIVVLLGSALVWSAL